MLDQLPSSPIGRFSLITYSFLGPVCGTMVLREHVAVAAGCAHTLGLKSDGTVVAMGDNEHGQCDVSDWRGLQLPGN